MPLYKPRPASDQALCLAGGDLLMVDDVTRYGLHRRHIVRYGGLPDLDGWLTTVPDVQIYGWIYMVEDVGHLWLVWKE